MSQLLIQPSFCAGEVAPALWARVDLAKYHVGAKVMRNFFVLPSGGVANRPGTQFVGTARNSAQPVRLIPFQFNTLQTYALEFGHQYMRVIMNGGYVLEPALTLTAVTPGTPGQISISGGSFAVGDWVQLTNVPTPFQSVTNKVFTITAVSGSTYTLANPDGTPAVIVGTASAAVSGASVARLYTLTTPYVGTDLALLKFVQNADTMTLTHPNYPPSDLTRSQHWVWTLTEVNFAPQVSAPSGVASTTNSGGDFFYAYVVTAETEAPPEESLPSSPASCWGVELNQNTGIQNTITWAAVSSATRYNIYKANPTYYPTIVPAGATYGYIGTATGTSFIDTNIAPDFTQGPPQGANPFNTSSITGLTLSGGVLPTSVTALTFYVIDQTGTGAQFDHSVTATGTPVPIITNGGTNYTAPTVVVAAVPPTSTVFGTGAALKCTWAINGSSYNLTAVSVTNGGNNYTGNTRCYFPQCLPGTGATPQVNLTLSGSAVTGATIANAGGGEYLGGAPQPMIIDQGAVTGYTPCPPSLYPTNVTMESGAIYPACASYFQNRKVFAGGTNSPISLWLTQSGSFQNMDVSNPVQDSDAISITIASRQVNSIRHLVSVNALLALTAGGAFKISSGTVGGTLTPSGTVATPQVYNGCSNVPPLVIGYDILYVQAMGSRVRDLSYNFYADVYTGSDLTILSPHLFYGYSITEWAYAEEPFNLVWAVRNDGVLLGFTYLKEQDVYAWTRHDTPGQFLSICTIPEGSEDAIYVAVSRTIPGINGGNPITYVERFHSRNFLTNGTADVTQAWFVDCGSQYSGPPVTSVSGLDHLNGATVSILADGNVQPQCVVNNGSITVTHPASTITVGLPYSSDLQTLNIEPPQGTIQSKRKRIPSVTLRLQDTRGLWAGPDQHNLTEIKERRHEAMGSPITLKTGDERLILPNSWNTDGTVFIHQPNPLPASILAVIPEIRIGDDG